MKKSDIEMLKSCFTYGYLGWSKYYKAIVEKYGEEATEKEVDKIEKTYEVEHNTYEDIEGCVYNSLILKK